MSHTKARISPIYFTPKHHGNRVTSPSYFYYQLPGMKVIGEAETAPLIGRLRTEHLSLFSQRDYHIRHQIDGPIKLDEKLGLTEKARSTLDGQVPTVEKCACRVPNN